MTISLTAFNRFKMYSVFTGNPLFIGLTNIFMQEIGFSEKEADAYPKIEDVKYEIPDVLFKEIASNLERMFFAGVLSEDQMELYKIFVGK